MKDEIISALARELKISEKQVRNTLEMLEQGDTVPFIARYRKEQTNGLDEEQILSIQKQYDYQPCTLYRSSRRIRRLCSNPRKRSRSS